ncbi:MAG: phosphate signaling complex protein PhoU [Bacillota bacterium]
MREKFDQELRQLQDKLLNLSNRTEESINSAVSSLAAQDLGLAQRVIAGDEAIDGLFLEIEDECFRTIARQQPIASDLRILTTTMKMATDLERIADHAVNIAEITLRIGGQKPVKPLINIPRMAALAEDMVHAAMQAFIERDAEKARENCRRDNDMDRIYEQVFLDIASLVQKGLSPEEVMQAINLLFVARFLERVGDHATNIGEKVIFLVTGAQEKY